MKPTMSLSCSMVPLSRRSERRGVLSSRPSTARLSCESSTTGTLSSMASDFSASVSSEISYTRFAALRDWSDGRMRPR